MCNEMAARILNEDIPSSSSVKEKTICDRNQRPLLSPSSKPRNSFSLSVTPNSTIMDYVNGMVSNNERTNIGSNLEASIVPDLMRVYDNLTQGSRTSHAARNSEINCATQGEQYLSFQTQAPVPRLSDKNTSYTHNTVPATINNTGQQEQRMLLLSSGGKQDASCRDKYNTQIQPQSQVPAGNPKLQAVPSLKKNTSKIGISSSSSRKRSIAESDRSNSDTDTKSRRKRGGNDGRWSKRFAWPDELHRDFVSSIFDVGLKNSSPSAILKQMGEHEQITPDRIKSHLQKYRLRRQKSKEEFMGSYDTALQKIKAGKTECDSNVMNCADGAARMSFATMNEIATEGNDAGSILNGGALHLPHLSESEKSSPIGASMGYLMGLFFSLKQQLLAQRASADNVSSLLPSVPSQPPPPLQFSAPIPTKYAQSGTQHQATYSPYNGTTTQISLASQCQGYPLVVPPPIQYQAPTPLVDHFQVPSPEKQGQHPLHIHFREQQPQGSCPPAQQQYHDVDVFTGIQDITSSPSPHPGPRNNTSLEENDIMKREMQSQMAFQTKIRKLKETELNKVMTSTSCVSTSDTPCDNHLGNSALITNCSECGLSNEADNIDQLHADIWTDVVDEDLFDFLINE